MGEFAKGAGRPGVDLEMGRQGGACGGGKLIESVTCQELRMLYVLS